jgi:hypothetical protein
MEPRVSLTRSPGAARASQLLSELVLVSAEAASVGGTSATLRTGEVYTVQDLLYGMLLPSGNDAAAALAEYLGDSFEPPLRCTERCVHAQSTWKCRVVAASATVMVAVYCLSLMMT